MRFGIIGRTDHLVNSAIELKSNGHELTFVATYDEGKSELNSNLINFANNSRVPHFHTRDLLKHYKAIFETKTEIAISINWKTLIPMPILDIFEFGVINAHMGDLPRYRGNATPNWAILQDEPKITLTLHKMNVELDAGPIALKVDYPLSSETYITDIYNWFGQVIPKCFLEVFQKIDTLKFQEQDNAIRPLRAFPRKPEDSTINWNRPADEILRLIRASSHPFDGALTTLNGSRIVQIFRAREYSVNFDFLAIPGQVCFKTMDGVVVACNNSLLEITECLISGKDNFKSIDEVSKSLRNRLE